jgi:hypothetical protein
MLGHAKQVKGIDVVRNRCQNLQVDVLGFREAPRALVLQAQRQRGIERHRLAIALLLLLLFPVSRIR